MSTVSKVSVATKRLLLGRPFRSDTLGHTLLPKRIALPVFASDAMSSVAYAPQEIFLVLSVAGVTGRPIMFASTGEGVKDFEVFHPDRMASRILGMGDVLSLIEDVQKGIDEEAAAKMAKKLQKGKGFDLNDFKEQNPNIVSSNNG